MSPFLSCSFCFPSISLYVVVQVFSVCKLFLSARSAISPEGVWNHSETALKPQKFNTCRAYIHTHSPPLLVHSSNFFVLSLCEPSNWSEDIVPATSYLFKECEGRCKKCLRPLSCSVCFPGISLYVVFESSLSVNCSFRQGQREPPKGVWNHSETLWNHRSPTRAEHTYTQPTSPSHSSNFFVLYYVRLPTGPKILCLPLHIFSKSAKVGVRNVSVLVMFLLFPWTFPWYVVFKSLLFVNCSFRQGQREPPKGSETMRKKQCAMEKWMTGLIGMK